MAAFGISQRVAICSLDKRVYILSAPCRGVRGELYGSRKSACFHPSPPCRGANWENFEYFGKSNKADLWQGGFLVLHRLISVWLQCDASMVVRLWLVWAQDVLNHVEVTLLLALHLLRGEISALRDKRIF